MAGTGFDPTEPKDPYTVRDHILTVSKYEECSKFLGTPYIEEQLPKNNIFLVVYKDSVPKGYIMANFLPDGVYLDVICAIERQGAPLLSLFIRLCKEHFHASYIQLSSLMHVLTYYPKLGFSHRKSCYEPPTVGMSPELGAYIMDKMRAGILTSDEAFFDDPKIGRFIKELHAHGYTKTHDPKTCQDPSLGLGLQKQRRCAKDGYTMIKCLNEDAVPPPSFVVPFEDYVRTVAPRSTKPPRELQNLLRSANTFTRSRRTQSIFKDTSKTHKVPRSTRTKTISTGTMGRAMGSRGTRGTPKPASSKSGTRKHPIIRPKIYKPLRTIRE